jgi:hypothetical protein
MIRILISLIAIMISVTAVAKKSKVKRFEYPPGCNQEGYSLDYNVLFLHPHAAGNPASLYFVYNNSKKPVTLYQSQRDDADYIINTNNVVLPKMWAVFATDEQKVKFICAHRNKKYKYGKLIDCSQVIKACEFTNVVFGLNNSGNYWVVTNNTKKGAIRQSVRHGILLRW